MAGPDLARDILDRMRHDGCGRHRLGAVSERALIGRYAPVGSFVQYGSRPHLSRSR